MYAGRTHVPRVVWARKTRVDVSSAGEGNIIGPTACSTRVSGAAVRPESNEDVTEHWFVYRIESAEDAVDRPRMRWTVIC